MFINLRIGLKAEIRSGLLRMVTALATTKLPSNTLNHTTSAIAMQVPKRSFSQISSLDKAKDYYDVLHLTRAATQREIDYAYNYLSKMCLSDRNKGSKEAAEELCKITEAYKVLGDIRTRRLYDKGIGTYGKAAINAVIASGAAKSQSLRG